MMTKYTIFIHSVNVNCKVRYDSTFKYTILCKTRKMHPEKIHSLFPLLAQWRSEMLFFFFLPFTSSLRVYVERRRKKLFQLLDCARSGEKDFFSGRIVRYLKNFLNLPLFAFAGNPLWNLKSVIFL